MPNVWSWLALEALLAGDIERASSALRQRLEGYSQLVALEGAVPGPHTQHHDRPDLLDALIATAHVQAAKSRMKLAVLALSAAKQMQMVQGYWLEPPLQAMADKLAYPPCGAGRAGV